MAAPGSFILFAVLLFLLFGACMIAGLVLLLVGWRKKARPVQFLAALPVGMGLFIIGPLLILDMIMVVWWFSTDWRGMDDPPSPPAIQERGR